MFVKLDSSDHWVEVASQVEVTTSPYAVTISGLTVRTYATLSAAQADAARIVEAVGLFVL